MTAILPSTSAPSLAGNLGEFTPFDVLQYLHISRRSGTLRLRRPDGLEAKCRLANGRIVAALCEHLEGREAVLSLVFWQKGDFDFARAPENEADEEGLSVEELVLEAVSIADALEMRSADLPANETLLRLAAPTLIPPDELECGLGDVVRAIENRGLTRRKDLENDLPLCATKIRLSLAILQAAGALSSSAGAAPSTEPLVENDLDGTWSRVRSRFPSGLRVLVAFAPETAIEKFEPALRALGLRLGAPTRVGAIWPVGPSIVRFRPPAGGVLSITLLPIARRDQYLYETFVKSVDVVLFCGWSKVAEVAEAWVGAVPTTADFEVLDETQGLDIELKAALNRCAEGLRSNDDERPV
jgi:Domain of unknown function (DUF4388)